MLVNASIILSSLLHISPYQPVYRQEVALEAGSIYSGFIVTVTNRVEIRHETCSILDSMLFLVINGEKFKFGCLHYWVHYFESPLHLRFIPALLASLSESIVIVVTAVRFACPPFHSYFRQCPNHPIFCVRRDLFCDGIDNCGFHSDETDCTNHLNQFSVVITDERKPNNATMLSILICFGISLFFLALFIMYRMYNARKQKYCTIKSLFGGLKPPKCETEPEETVALLTLGLKNFLPHSSNYNYPFFVPNYDAHRVSRTSLRFNRL